MLAEWRWLCPLKLTLVATTVFGELFLKDESGKVFWLDTGIGVLSIVADSEDEFLTAAAEPAKREEWFAESDELAALARGLKPGPNECIGFSVPLVFAEGGSPDTAYVADIYDCVGFLGDLHRQIATLPDGSKVRLKVK